MRTTIFFGSLCATVFVACATHSTPDVIITSGLTASDRATACAIATEPDETPIAKAVGSGADPIGVGDPDDGKIVLACCTNPAGCTPHDFPPEKCSTQPTVADAQLLSGGFMVAYHGADPVVATYTGCDGDDQNHCDATNSGFVYQVYSQVDYVARVVTPTSLEVFALPAGATAVKVPTGEVVFPLKHHGDVYADPAKPVALPDGSNYELDYQDDCVQDEDGCGNTCGEC